MVDNPFDKPLVPATGIPAISTPISNVVMPGIQIPSKEPSRLQTIRKKVKDHVWRDGKPFRIEFP